MKCAKFKISKQNGSLTFTTEINKQQKLAGITNSI